MSSRVARELWWWAAGGAIAGGLIGLAALALDRGGGDGPMIGAYLAYFLGWPTSLILWDSSVALPWPARDLQVLVLNGAVWGIALERLAWLVERRQRAESAPPAA